MRSFSALLLLTFSGCLLGAAHAQSVSCANAQFSDAVLQRFPSVRAACLDVIAHEGNYFAVFKADLLQVTAAGVQIRPALPDGKHADARFVQVSEQRRVLVDGKRVRFSDLELGQELTVYIKVTEPLVAIAPSEERGSWALAPLEEVDSSHSASAEPPPMPHTASALPYFGTGGGALMVCGVLLGLMRRRRASQCEKSIATLERAVQDAV